MEQQKKQKTFTALEEMTEEPQKQSGTDVVSPENPSKF